LHSIQPALQRLEIDLCTLLLRLSSITQDYKVELPDAETESGMSDDFSGDAEHCEHMPPARLGSPVEQIERTI
jgi:hypothetical protein